MNYLHYDVDVRSGEAVQVELDKQANVRLLDDVNYSNYRNGRRHDYYGGRAVKSPVMLQPPRPGKWHVVIDLGGNSGSVRAAVQTVSL